MSGGISIISLSSLGYSRASYGKMALPVDPSSLIYSHFEHVSGISAPKGTYGLTISRLHLLDVLIGQLNQIKKASFTHASANPVGGVDSLIENLNKQVRQAKSDSQAMPYKPSPSANSGALFNLLR